VIAHRLIEVAEAAHISLEAEGDALVVEAEGKLPPDLIEGLRQHKAEVIATLVWLRRPRVLRDGRRLYRFRADTIPLSVPNSIAELIDSVRNLDAVLVADGRELIVVDRPGRPLSDQTLRALRSETASVIAALRQEAGFEMQIGNGLRKAVTKTKR
jgi:hypothetical protein